MNALDRFFARRRPTAILAMALVMAAAIGWIDFATGIYLSFALFYLVPVGLATVYAGRAYGLTVAVICATVGLVGDVSNGGTHTFYPTWNAAARLGVFMVVVIVLSQLRTAHQTERRLARTDPLTGVANFRWFEEEAQREMYSSRRYGGPLSLIYLDLDDFKKVNDDRGHAAGDEVLRSVASALRASLRPTDLVARIGGDEFVVLLPHTDREGAEKAIERARHELTTHGAAGGIGFSVGIIQLDQVVGSIDDLVGKADELMYTAKHAKKHSRPLAETDPVRGKPLGTRP
jgi:diguanylate cyclase (GGDEF)-like protein